MNEREKPHRKIRSITLTLRSTHFFIRQLLFPWILSLFCGAISLHGIVVDFDLSLDTVTDGGLNYIDLNKAGAGTSDSFAIGFNVEVTAVDGQSVNINPVAAFCAEIQEPIDVASHSFDLDPLSALSAGRAGEAGTASSNIPTGGIGALRAARLAYLFDNFYISNQLSTWTMTDTEPNLHAFQLAVWEVTHDDGLTLDSGQISLGTQTLGNNPTRRENARILANTWLNTITAANVDASYTSSLFSFWGLTNTDSVSPTEGSQDVILAFVKDSPDDQTFTDAVPEPSETILMTGFLALCFVGARRAPSAR